MSIKSWGKTLFVILLSSPLLSAPAYSDIDFFTHNGNKIAGYYLAPTNSSSAKPKAVLLFVHGDGSTPYDAHGYYDIVWNEMRNHGFAIFSWDKLGVGDSQGSWLNQTMQDRQSEVEAAIDFVQSKWGYSKSNTGLIGFSQAGWVVPAVAKRSDKLGFVVGIGFATNWIDQGRYYGIRKSKLKGENERQTQASIDRHKQEIAFLNTQPKYEAYREYEKHSPMSKERFEFVLNNYKSDATDDYQGIRIPTLLMWGEDDENVDAHYEYDLRKNAPNPYISTKLVPNATHALLNSKSYKGQSFGFFSWLKMIWQDKHAFAKGSLSYLINWLNNVEHKQKPVLGKS